MLIVCTRLAWNVANSKKNNAERMEQNWDMF